MKTYTAAIPGRPAPYFTRLKRNFRNHWELYLLILPALAYFVIFQYIPMYGVQIAFRDYLPGVGFFESPWVGLDNFRRFFRSYSSAIVIGNTLKISLMGLILGVPCPILLSLMLNELRQRRFKNIVQTVSYAPHFISAVAMAGMIMIFLSERGVVNSIITAFGGEKTSFMSRPELFASIYVLGNIWKNTGYNSIIYLAALSSIDMDLYEAARIDGASRFKMIRHIDIPGIMPTMIILLILNAGRIMSVGYEQILLMQNTLNKAGSEIISTYTYQMGLIQNDFSYSTAIGLFNSVVNLILLFLVNTLARRVSETSLW